VMGVEKFFHISCNHISCLYPKYFYLHVVLNVNGYSMLGSVRQFFYAPLVRVFFLAGELRSIGV
jgi:hypothetical protein